MLEAEIKQKFLEAYEQLANPVFRHCFLRVSDREIARDITQETFTRTWQCLADGEAVRNMKAFVFRIANNLIIDHYRKKKTDSLETLQEKGFDVIGENSTAIENQVEFSYTLRLIDQLESSYRQVVLLRLVDDLSPQEIAEILGENKNVISVRIHRGLKKLRALLNNK